MVQKQSKVKKQGRPISTIDDLPEDWEEAILSLYQEGGSDVEVKALIYNWRGSFSNDLWDRWLKDEPRFSQTIKKGKLLAEAWWHKNGRVNLKDREFNYTGWYMQMKNRFGWKDTQQIDTNINIPSLPSIIIKTNE